MKKRTSQRKTNIRPSAQKIKGGSRSPRVLRDSDDRVKGGGAPKLRFSRRLEVLYEDRDVLAINKPAGLASVAPRGTKTPSAFMILKESGQRCSIVHRIDKYTSGILLFAKNEVAQERLVKQFLAREPRREYVAVVRGALERESGTLVHYLKRVGEQQVLSKQRDRDAGRAELSYRVMARLRGVTLVRVSLVSGFQNQIRVQFAAEGHPLVGDRKYAAAEAAEKRILRVALHAALLSFQHPRTQRLITVECPLAPDIERFIAGVPRQE